MNSADAAYLSLFENFLAKIPLDHYRNELASIKTVEQDLPRELNPIPAIYASYWKPDPIRFPDYEDFFCEWWNEKLRYLDGFIKKYFWGCSYQFVQLGFKARLYRTLISVLTQFHFSYSWLAHCKLPLEASPELDLHGIDALVTTSEAKKKIALQMKKETYRSEAKSPGRFAQRQIQVNLIVEVPYTIVSAEDLRKRTEKARKKENRKQFELLTLLAEELQQRLPNGFVIFQPNYPKIIEKLIEEVASQEHSKTLSWRETLEWIASKINIMG